MFSRCTNRSLMMKCTVPLFSSNWLGSPKLCSFSEYYSIIIHTSHQFDGFHFFFPWMQKLEFKFPLTVSCVHFICSSIGAYIAIKILKMKPLIEVAPEDRWRRIFPMSFVFCINIVLGNVSLRYIPVSFMQTIKSFTPATTGSLIPGLSKLFFFLSSLLSIQSFSVIPLFCN